VTADNYQTVFELGFRSFPWTSIIRPLVFIGMGLLLIQLFKRRTFYVMVGAFVASMSLLFFLLSLMIFVPNFVKLRAEYVSGKSVVVEGVIRDFHPAPAMGPAIESFDVNTAEFAYNALDDTPCFHDAPLHKVPIREGLIVRIHYHEDCIQRVEILREAGGSPRSDHR
jgi:hypothetical protein